MEVLGDENGWVRGMNCVEMELGEPDESGRRRPIVKEGSEFELDVDTMIMALGTSPNPLIRSTTPGPRSGPPRLPHHQRSRRPHQPPPSSMRAATPSPVRPTVILAMGAGKEAAKAIDKAIREKNS